MSDSYNPVPSRERFTDAQRRRAEALILVKSLFPTASLGCSHAQAACWIATGRLTPTAPA